MSKEQIQEKILEAIKTDPHRQDIKKISLFGSWAYAQPRQDSDVDVLVEFFPEASIGLFELVRIQRHMSEAVGKNIDLLTPQSLSKYFRDEVMAKAQLIYEK